MNGSGVCSGGALWEDFLSVIGGKGTSDQITITDLGYPTEGTDEGYCLILTAGGTGVYTSGEMSYTLSTNQP
jgi:hypothetical protein